MEPKKTNAATPVVYVYHEYYDDLPYGEQTFKVFATKDAGMRHLKSRVKSRFGIDFDCLEDGLIIDEETDVGTVLESYVSFCVGDDTVFFSLDERVVE